MATMSTLDALETDERPAEEADGMRGASLRAAVTVGVATLALGLAALLGPNLVDAPPSPHMAMPMTHYMELLALRQPWNLLLFMAVPVVIAETLAISEIAMLVLRPGPAWVGRLNHLAGLAAGWS